MNTLRWTSVIVWLVPALALAQGATPAPAPSAVPPPTSSPEAGDEWVAPAEPAPEAPPADAVESEPPPEEEEPADAPGPLVIGAELGAIFPQPFSELGTHVSFGLELGYALPFLEQKLEVMLGAAYAPPANDFKVAGYEGAVDVQELTFSLGARYRFLARTDSPAIDPGDVQALTACIDHLVEHHADALARG